MLNLIVNGRIDGNCYFCNWRFYKMIERILEILKLKGMSPSQFADEIGVQRSAISHLVSGRNNPSLDFIQRVLKRFPGCEYRLAY